MRMVPRTPRRRNLASFPAAEGSSAARCVPARAGKCGFTLIELLLVMAMIGFILGIGSLGLERMDPGARGAQETLRIFVESSRDRARATGFPVVLEYQPGEQEGTTRMVRYVYRPMIEASFEPRYERAHGIELLAPANMDTPGRCGAALDLRQGGEATITGRGGRFRATNGLALEMQMRSEDGSSGRLIGWDGLLDVRMRRDGSLTLNLETVGDEGKARIPLQTEPGVIVPGRWQHLRITAADQAMLLQVDGREIGRVEILARLPNPEGYPRLGDAQAGWQGMFDEFVVHARAEEVGPELMEAVEIRMGSPRMTFDRFGLLDAGLHADAVPIEIFELDLQVGSFKVGRFSEEEMAP